MSSMTPIEVPHFVVEAAKGRVQFSGPTADKTVGLLVERDESFCGVILSEAEAEKLARQMLASLGLN